MLPDNLEGQKFGKLTVIKRVENSKAGKAKWLCLCSCGREKPIIGGNLKHNKVETCGCVHGLTRKEYVKSKVKADEKTGCWIWMGDAGNGGYGSAKYHGKRYQAHRLAYESFVGRAEEGLLVCHNCPGGDNPRCCNPDHLWLGSSADNSSDMRGKNRQAKGVRIGTSKLTESEVKGIKNVTPDIPTYEIAARFNVHPSTIRSIKNQRTWSHV